MYIQVFILRFSFFKVTTFFYLNSLNNTSTTPWMLTRFYYLFSCVLFLLVASENERFSTGNGNSNLENGVDNGINKSTNGREESVPVEERVTEGVGSDEGANLRSSFEEVNQENHNPEVNSAVYGFGEHLSQNSGVSDQ